MVEGRFAYRVQEHAAERAPLEAIGDGDRHLRATVRDRPVDRMSDDCLVAERARDQ